MTQPFLKKLLPLALLLAACSSESNSTQPGNPDNTYNPNAPNNPNPGSTVKPAMPGATDFTTEEAGGLNGQNGDPRGAAGPGSATGAPPSPPSSVGPESVTDAGMKSPPGGRLADVEEADIYKVDKNRLFYLNTYRGFMIYDVNDTKNPKRVSRLPVFGYPVEMFVSGNTVYALLRDALYLTQVGDQVQFERHNVSQLVTIDITDLANPKIIKKIDIIGQLREGVSRKIENTIYVVSYIPRTYYWGWRPDPSMQKEKATVYSFNVADPQNVREVNKLQIFEGGSITVQEGGYYYDRSFSSVAISATSNALMVVENWNVSAYQSGPQGVRGESYGCGSSSSNQFARVSLVDISNPNGDIKLQAQFQTDGRLEDQFKMTYVHDPVANTGTFFGIFARQVWLYAGCRGDSFTQNNIESWDVSVTGKPAKLDELSFGKKNELVRGSAFDPDRKVAYAITAVRTDPLYALSIADRKDLRVLSEIDGLSGEMSVFRLVGGKKFLLGVGTDNSGSCTGFGAGTGFTPTKIAVSLIDVQDLSKIRLVQRRCVAIKGADWIGSGVSNNLDQAHKMLGMHADGDVNVITVPVHYSKRVDSPDSWWWYRWETAVGLMTWNLTKYDPLKSELQQSVIENYGTFVHPHGEVRRSIVFTHEGATPRRMMINLSDTHVSVANLVDMNNPSLESVVEVAPYYNQIYRFGDYLVEQVQAKPQAWGSPSQDVATFRVRKAGGPAVDDAPVLKSFDVGQVYRVFKHDNSLVLFRRVQDNRTDPVTGVYIPPSTEALVVDMRNPASPRLAGRATVPLLTFGYYRYWCGMSAYWGGFWFDQQNDFAATERGLVFYSNQYEYQGPNLPGRQRNRLVFLDLLNPDAPVVSEKELESGTDWDAYSLVSDPMAPSGFYLSHRKRLDEQKTATGLVYTRFKYYAQRWERQGDAWAAQDSVNIPGRLIRTWRSGAAGNAGGRMFLTQDTSYREGFDGTNRYYLYDYRLSLLRAVQVQGRPAAELLDVRILSNLYPSALLLDGDRLYLNGRPQMNYFGYYGVPSRGGVATTTSSSSSSSTQPLPSWETTSDRLMIFELAGNKLEPKYDQPTRMYNVQLMGIQAGKLFVNLAGNGQYYDWGGGSSGGGDGILVVDVANPAAPKGVKFMRTLGLATHIEFFGDDVYVASGHFGLYHMSMASPPDLLVSSM